MLKVIVIDDEKNVREALTSLVSKYAPGFEVIGAYNDLAAGMQAITNHSPDIVMLDIELGKNNAFDIYKYFPAPFFKIIFVTAYQHYAVQAFRFSATDYLLKPVDPDILLGALQKAKVDIDKEKFASKIDCLLHNLSTTTKRSKRLVLKTTENMHIVEVENIMYCEANRGYTCFYLSDKSKITVSVTLGEYEDMLNDFDFIRIHHSYLLNINYIKRFNKTDGGTIVLKNDTSLPVATRKREQVLEVLRKL